MIVIAHILVFDFVFCLPFFAAIKLYNLIVSSRNRGLCRGGRKEEGTGVRCRQIRDYNCIDLN